MHGYLAGLRETEPVVVARKDLPPGWRIGPGDVEQRLLPRGAGHPLSVRDVDEADGQVVTAAVWEGEPVLLADLAGAGTGGALAALLGPGERAVYVPAGMSRLGGFEAGDWVDLVAVWGAAADGDAGHGLVSAARVLRLEPDDFGGGGFVAAVPAAAVGDVALALDRGSLFPVLRPLSGP